MKRIGKFRVGRDAIGRLNVVWMNSPRQEGPTLTLTYGALRPYPPMHGSTVAITPKAYAENPGILAEAFIRVWQNAQATHRLLVAKGKKGLRLDRLEFVYVKPGFSPHGDPLMLSDGEPGTDDLNHLISWKAMAR